MQNSTMRIDYPSIAKSIASLTEGETDEVALMATVVCELHHADERFDWTGFYRIVAPELLKIGPYQGGHGCLVIPFSRGVCGAAARNGEVQLVADVDAFPGHIACASSTRFEIHKSPGATTSARNQARAIAPPSCPLPPTMPIRIRVWWSANTARPW